MPLRTNFAYWKTALGLFLFLFAWAGNLSAENLLPAGPVWVADYAAAIREAKDQGRMVFIYFEDRHTAHTSFATKVLTEPSLRKRLGDFVCVKAPVDATIQAGGKAEVLLNYASFKGMQGKAGVAILDFAHKDAAYYGCVVSAFPFPEGGVHSVPQVAIMLELPAGTRQERAVVYNARSCNCAPLVEAGVVAKTEKKPAEPKAESPDAPEFSWFTSYAKAVEEASAKRKMLLVFFWNDEEMCRRFERESLDNLEVRKKMRDYVCVRLPVQAKILVEGKEAVLLEQRAFQEMLRRPGVAIIDFANPDCAFAGCVVSTFPLTQKLTYDAHRMQVILDLPRGTLTQRTLVYAVRIHPERPQSTDGQVDNNLAHEAESHSQYQANIRLQGHHTWETRFHRINAILPFGLVATEVCAESWPGENLVEAAIECVRCWRTSDGHWRSVVARHRVFGYDMKRGPNGIWYATGIFGKGS